MLRGIWLTLQLGFLAWIIALFLGVFLARCVLRHEAVALGEHDLRGNFSECSLPCPALLLVLRRSHDLRQDPSVQDQRHLRVEYYSAAVGWGFTRQAAWRAREGRICLHRQGQYQQPCPQALITGSVLARHDSPRACLAFHPYTDSSRSSRTLGGMTIGVAETTFMSYKSISDTFHGLEATTGAMFVYLSWNGGG